MKFNLKFSSMEKYFDSIQTTDQLYCDLKFQQNVLTQRNKSSLLIHHQLAHLYISKTSYSRTKHSKQMQS